MIKAAIFDLDGTLFDLDGTLLDRTPTRGL